MARLDRVLFILLPWSMDMIREIAFDKMGCIYLHVVTSSLND